MFNLGKERNVCCTPMESCSSVIVLVSLDTRVCNFQISNFKSQISEINVRTKIKNGAFSMPRNYRRVDPVTPTLLYFVR